MVSGRANPIRNAAGEMVKWFGICTDIDDQKQGQQILKGQIQEQTLQLADVNTRLQRELYFRRWRRGFRRLSGPQSPTGDRLHQPEMARLQRPNA